MVSEPTDGDIVVCRTCISECTEYKSIYNQGIFLGEVRTLASMLSFITDLEFGSYENESFPTNICLRCVHNVAKTYAFKRLVLDTEEVLRKQFVEIEVSGENEGANSVDEEQLVEVDTEEAIEVKDDDTDQLNQLANAAQMKRNVENMEYVSVSVLDNYVGTDETTMSEDHSQNNIDDYDEDQNCEEEVIVADSEEVYQTDDVEIVDDRDSSEEIYEIREIDQAEYMSDNCEEQPPVNTAALQKPRIIAIKSECQLEFATAPKPRKKSGAKPQNPDLQCKECGKQLSNPNSFRYHMQLHSDHTPYMCNLCGDGFKTRNAYEGHLSIHDPNNPNTCELCGKAYRQASSLRTHMLSHTGERPFQCDICGKSMTQKSGYKKHMLIHTGEKPHACDICGREFRYSSNLIAHKRCHTGERPYECTHCKRSYASSEQLKRHMVVHTTERPFQCSTCFKNFKRRASLISHQHTHENEPELIVDHKVCKSKVVELL